MKSEIVITLKQKAYDIENKVNSLFGEPITFENWVKMAHALRDFLDCALQSNAADIALSEIFRKAVGFLAKGPKSSVTTAYRENADWRKDVFYSKDETNAMLTPFNEAIGYLKVWCELNDGDEPPLDGTTPAPEHAFYRFCEDYERGTLKLFKPSGSDFMFKQALFARLSACFPVTHRPLVPHEGLTAMLARDDAASYNAPIVEAINALGDKLDLNNRLHGMDRIDEITEEGLSRKGRRRAARTPDQDRQEQEILTRYKDAHLKGLLKITKSVLSNPKWQLPEGYPATPTGIKQCHDRLYALTHPRP